MPTLRSSSNPTVRLDAPVSRLPAPRDEATSGVDASPRARPRGPLSAFALALAVTSACGSGERQPGPEPSARPATSESAAPASSLSAAPEPPPAPAEDVLVGEGVASFAPIGERPACAAASFELATYLMRGELALAGRGAGDSAEFAASWLVQLKGKAQIGFAGFDGKARRIARDRGIGNAREQAPKIYADAEAFTVLWFDAAGLAYARPRWATEPAPEIEHLGAVRDVPPEDIGLATTPSGALVAASPFGTEGDQLSLFLLSTASDAASKTRAVGITKSAKKPRRPVVAADDGGYTVAWIEAGPGSVHATRFDAAGRETGAGGVVRQAAPGEVTAMSLVSIGAGASRLVWLESGRVLTRKLDATGKADSPIHVLGKGRGPAAIPAGGDALVAWLAEGGDADGQLVLVRVGSEGPGKAGLRVSDGKTKVLDPPAIAMAGGRLGLVWTEVMGPVISSKRAWLRSFDASCVD